jgi:hypothetical protein
MKNYPMTCSLYQSNAHQRKRFSFAHTGNETRFTFKMFRSYNFKVALKASITLQKHLCQEQSITNQSQR